MKLETNIIETLKEKYFKTNKPNLLNYTMYSYAEKMILHYLDPELTIKMIIVLLNKRILRIHIRKVIGYFKYDTQASNKIKHQLKKIYKSLNPAELKREIYKKLNKLYQVYSQKQGRKYVKNTNSFKKLKASKVSF